MTANQIKNLLLSLANDDQVSPEFIEVVIRKYIVRKPILPLTDFYYAFVVRSSPNGVGEVFSNVSRCSYSPFPEKIELQRCNYKGQQVFYAAVASQSKNIHAVGTALMETGFLYAKSKSVSRYYFTISKWVLARPLKMFVLPFSKRSTKYNEDFKTMNKNFDQLLTETAEKYHVDSREIKSFLEFMSHVFTYPFKKKQYYKISSAFFNAILHYGTNVDGLIYPSAMTKAEGMNVALRKDLIDDGVLKVNVAIMYALQRNPSNPKDINFYDVSHNTYPDRKGNLRFDPIF